ncbi:MAG: Bug family tripartite tricarboxylate transporter substrate binding protein [Xanthobacteraceae bacterium]
MTILILDLRRAGTPECGPQGAGCLSVAARLRRAAYAFATFLAMLVVATGAHAWPERPVTVIVPYSAGGNTDTMARMASEWLSVQLKQRFVVENRVGAGGTIAAAFVAQSKPDGYTLLFGAAPQLLIAPLIQKVSYDARKDFAPVAVFGTGPHVMAVHASVPGKTIGDFITYAKANPGKVNYASGGQGTSGHLHAALFASRAGLDMVHVPYRGGAPATADLLAGQVQMYFGNAAELLPHIGSDKIRLILVSSARRMPQLPDAPTLEELFPGFKLPPWNGFLAPAATPKPILELLAKETVAATKNPAIVQRLSDLGIEPGGPMLDGFQKDIDQSRSAFEDAVKAAGLKPM